MIFETVAVIDGVPRHLEYHQQRLERSRRELGIDKGVLSLVDLIRVPEEYCQGLIRCRIDYAEELIAIKFSPFKPAPVKSLLMVESDIAYPHKWSDRSGFEQLRAQHAEYDDVVILRGGLVTDSTMANLAFLQQGSWFTPEQPLLPGTMRARLIEKGVLQARAIPGDRLSQYEGVVLINALRGFNPELAVPISRIATV